ncbi:hypothetical protein CLV82_1526 [Zeaxanthinibacter enoshimensis]|uniref:Gliding motility-associated-like protein n=2 Tax=Zeaxanthinibacter enoshimensis TaxID=392009 RepID=A0A4R6TQQ4_9FLAO|nr:hypothetical protein CLV82_1526 [Zeaxanthinibacter enoshimensis]
MGKKILFLLLLISGTAFSQTTVSLQDQCNCEVLSGTAVTSPGAATPTGADVGDIYVNTDTGIIYFWDGNSWELTSSDDQQLQSFSFNPASRILSLQIENGNTVSVDLSFLNNTGTDDQVASEVLYNNTVSGLLAGNVQEALDEINAATSNVALVDNSDGTYTFTDADGTVTVISDTSISTLTDNGDGTYTYTDESNTVQTIDTNASSNPYDNTVSGLFATNVQAAIDEINAAAGTVALVDNGDGTYDFTDAAGNVTTITDTSISTLMDNGDGSFTYTAEDGTVTIFTESLTTLVDNNDGTFTYTNEDGTPQLVRKADMIDNFDGTYTFTNFGGTTLNINTNAISNPYDNTASGLFATNVQAAIDEVNAAAGTVALVDNGDGTYDFTDASGNVTTITDTSISTLADNGNGTYTYTDEAGNTQLIDTNASSNPYDNSISGLLAANVQDAIDEVNAAAGTVALVDNGDGTYDFTDAAGNVTTITDTSISTLVDNGNGTYTYTDEAGNTQLIDTNASSNPYNNAISGLAATNVQAAIDEVNAAAGTVALVDNGDGTYDFTDAGGNVTTISDTSISTLVNNGDGTYTYTDETGATQSIDTNASSNPYNNAISGLTATNVQAAIDEVNAAAGTVALVDNGDGTYDFTDASGNVTTITDTSISTLVDNGDGSFTYTAEDGTVTIFTESLTTLVDNNDGTFTYTNEDGTPQLVRKADMIDNFDGTYTFTNFGGTTLNINTNAISNPYDNTASGLLATNVQAAIDEVNAAAGTVSLVDNGDGTYDFTDAGGNVTTISDTSVSTLVNNGDGTYTYTDETGATQSIDTNASSNPYNNAISGLAATNVQAAIDEVNAAAGTVALVDNGDGTYDFTDAGGNVTTISDTSISTLVNNGDGTYTYTDETGATQSIDTNASSNPYNNAISGLAATNVQAAIDEVNAAAGTVALVDNGDGTYDFTDAGGNVTTISDTSISTLVNNGDGTYTYTDETGATQSIDTNASSNPYNNAISGLTATNVQAAIDEVNAAAGTVALVDNGDGTYDFTDASGNVTTITDTSISTLMDNGDGSFTYTAEDGTVTIFTESLTTLVDNNDGTFTYTNEDGTSQLVRKADMIDNFDGTYTFTNFGGTTLNINTNAISNPYDNTASGLFATNVQAAIDEVNAAAGTVALVDNGDGTYDFTDAAGNVTTISDTSVSTLVNNGDGTYTYTDETGATQSIDTNASSNPYNNAISGLAATNVQAAIDEVNAAAGTVALVDNGDGTYDFTDAGGNVTTISDTSISTLVNNGDGTYTYTDETGATQSIDTNASSNPYNNAISGLTATNVQAAIDEVNAAAGTVALVDNGDGTYDFTDAAGNVTTISDTSVSTLVNNGDGTYTYTDETGATQSIDTNASSNPYNNAISGLAATNVQAAIDEVNAAAGTVALVDNGDGTYDFTDAAGNVTTISDTSVSTLVNNGDGTYTYTDETGATQSIDTNASSNPYNNAVSGLLANNVQAAIDEVVAASSDDQLLSTDGSAGNISIEAGNSLNINVDDADADPANEFNTGIATNAGALEVTDGGGTLSANLVSADANNDIVAGTDGALYLNVASVSMAETVTNLVDNGNGTITYTNEDGTPQTVNKSDITDNGDGTYLFTNNDGSDVILDTRANANPYDNTTSGLLATDVQAAIDELNAAAGTVALVDNGDGTYDFTDAGGNVTTITDTSVSTLVNNGNGTYTYTDETGATQLIDTNASSNPYDNTTSGLVATDVQAAIDEVNAAAGTVALVDNGDGTYDFTDAAGNVTTITDTSISTLADNGDGSFTYTAEDGTVTIFTETLTTLVDNGNGTFTYTNEDGTAQMVRKADMIDNFDGTYTFTNFGATLLNIDTNAGSNPYDNTTSGLLAGNVQDAIDEIVSASSDDQNISGSGLLGTDLTIGIENGASQVIDLSSLVGTDDQNLTGATLDASNILQIDIENGGSAIVDLSSLDNSGTDDQNISGSGLLGTDLTIGIENGTSETISLAALVDDADADPTNEFNTAVGTNAGSLEITDGGGVVSAPLISADANNDIAAGTDGALYLNVASVAMAETVTNLVDNANGTLTYTNEDGVAQTVSKSDITDNGDGTYTFTNNDGSDVVINTIDADSDASNELQTISRAGTDITLSDGGGTVSVADNDNDPANEIELPAGGAGGQVLSTDGAGNYSWINDNGGTDDQDIMGSNLTGTDLTIGIENGASQVIDLSSLVGTDDQTAAEVTYDNTASGLLAGNTQDAIDEIVSTSSDDQNISGSNLTGTDLTIGIENGTSQTISLAALVDDADADPTNEIELPAGGAAGQVLSTDGAGNYSWISDDAGTDSQTLSLAGNNLSISNGNTIDISSIDTDTDDQTLSLAGNTLSIADGNSVDLTPFNNSGTDDQNISGSGLLGTDLTIGIENGTSETISLASLVDDADADPTNEFNTASGMNAGALEITDGGGTESVSLISTDANNDISAGTDGALYLNVASVTISETITNLVDNANGTFTYTNESGAAQTISKADITDNGDGTYTFTNNDGSDVVINTIDADSDASNELQTISRAGTDITLSDGGGTVSVADNDNDPTNEIELPAGGAGGQVLSTDGAGNYSWINDNGGTDDQTATEVTYDNTASGLLAGNTQDAIDEIVSTSSDDQNISGSNLTGTDLTIGIENGTSQTISLASLVDDADADPTNEIELPAGGAAGQVLSTDGAGNYSWISDDAGTDSQTLSLAGNNLSISNGNTIDISSIDTDTDDQTLSLAGNTLSIADGNSVDLTPFNDSGTDDQNISGSGLAGTVLTIGIENGSNETVDLATINTDDQGVDTFSFNGVTNQLTLEVEADGQPAHVVDLSALDNSGTDDQTLSTSGAAGNISIEDGNTLNLNVDDADADATNELQTITRAGTDLTLSNGGGTVSVADNDNDPTNEIELPAGGAGGQVLSTDGAGNYSWINDNGGSDDQNLTGATLNASNILQIDIENGGSTTVDLSSLDNSGTDDQNISGSNLTGTDLTIGIENGTSQTISLASLVDDADADPTNEIELPVGGAAGQVLSTDGAGNYSWISDDAGTDSQTLSLAGNNLSISNGNTIDISSIDTDTDDQTLSLAGNTLSIADGNSVDLTPFNNSGTDDQNISGSGLAGTVLTIGIENGSNETVDLATINTDEQGVDTFSFNGVTNQLTLEVEADGQPAHVVDLSALDNSGTDDQTLSTSGAAGNISIEDGNTLNLNVDDADADATNELQTITRAGTDITLSNGGGTVSVADNDNDPTNEIELPAGGAGGQVLSTDGAGNYSWINDNGGTDSQTLSLAGNNLSISNGNTIDISSIDTDTDDQTLSLAGNTLSIADGNSVDLTPFNNSGTDDQNLTGASLNASNILQIDIENGTSTTVDLSSLDNSGTDDQFDDEVQLRTAVDMDEGGVASPTLETNVAEAIQAIAPITSKAARIFYPPSIAVDASTNGSFTVDLYAQYTAQFGTPTVASSGAPAAVPTYAATELYYYVTYADPAVFDTATMSIDANGVLSYDIIGQPSDYNSLINVVFVVK